MTTNQTPSVRTGLAATGPSRALLLASLASLAALPLAGCSDAGGGSGARSTSGAVTPGGAGTSTGQGTGNVTSLNHRNKALAALGGAGAALPAPALEQAALDTHNDMIARCWPKLRAKMIDPMIEAQIRSQIAALAPSGLVRITGLRNLVLDTAAPIGLACSAVSGGRQRLILEAPRAPGAWRVGCTVDIVAQVQVNVIGVPIALGFSFDVTADISDVRVTADGTLDYATTSPTIASVGTPAANLRITLSSTDPMFQQVAGTVTAVLDPILRVALVGGAIYAQQQAMPLLRQYTAMPFRPAAQPAQGVPGAPSLEALAVEISDEVQRHHLPFGTLFPAVFSDPTFGQGTPVEYYDQGDSSGWTMHYVMGEVIRHDVTGDPRALAGAERGLQGLRHCLDVGGAGVGMLARCAIPVSDPLIRQINNAVDYYEGDINGVRYGALGDMSRDHYLESLMGLTQAWTRVPSLRARAGSMITEMCDYIQRDDFIAYKKPGSTELSRATPWVQSPGGIWAYALASHMVDPQRYAALHAQTAPVTPIIWLAFWASALDVHSQYYKHNLGADEIVTLTTIETDPARYRDYVKVAVIHHDGVKDHDNAWFDTVYAMAVPSAVTAMGPRVQNALERWTLRPRRCFPTSLQTDPTIPKVMFTDPLTGLPEPVAAEPIPIERRPPNDFLWQRSPFEMTNWGLPPTYQYPGVDLSQPYWAARAYGLIP